MTKAVKKLTNRDKLVLSAIEKCGFVALHLNGEPGLEIDFPVTAYRLNRLVTLGLLEPTGDNLIPGMPSQTFRITQAAMEAKRGAQAG